MPGTLASAVLFVLATFGLHAQDSEVARLKRSATPTCALAGLVAAPPPGWINIPFESPPPGALGCLMLRYNASDQLLGVIRVLSASAPTPEFADDSYDALLAREIASLTAMDIVIDVDNGPLFARDNVPIKGAGFRDARGVGLRASIKGNDVPQEAHLMVFRSDTSKYLVSLVTPGRNHDKPLYDENTNAMGTLIRTLKPAGQR